ncbi:NBR1-Ig-like domain-containing protein [Chitinimonas lacunae]|uniref:NBR1-Ig-like domain-containing protein n=1 Tax=Chitinimonas lacunae TaxID=1963018 RepID=A0ABV8MP51_9NEIS
MQESNQTQRNAAQISRWRVANCLEEMLAEINKRWPGRDKSSDGSIGDEAHQKDPNSDHNPWVIENGVGVVRARDFDVDGIDAEWLAEHLRLRGLHGDKRLRGGGYVIYNRRIAGAYDNWDWQPYSGDNPHTGHIHVSVSRNKEPGYDSSGKWFIYSQRDYEPIRAESLPRNFDRALSGWSIGFDYVLENALREYAAGRGVGRFAYRFSLPEFPADIGEASVAAVLSSAQPNVEADVVLVVNGVVQSSRRVPAAGANVNYSEWTIPASALVSNGANTVEFRLDQGNAAGLRVHYRVGETGATAPIVVTMPAGSLPVPTLENDSAFLVQRVPTVMQPGSTQRVTIEMRNIGTTTWRPGRHKLGSDLPQDNTTWGRSRVDLTEPVPPGGTAVFSFDVTAPANRGEYVFRWKMLEEHVKWFGPGTTKLMLTVGDALPPTAPKPDRLRSGETMRRGSELVAPNGLYKLAFQDDGNIVLYGLSPTRAIWATNRRGAVTLTMQGDGNLVAYDAQNRPAWDTVTRGSKAVELRLQEDGNLVLYTEAGKAVWTTRTNGR